MKPMLYGLIGAIASIAVIYAFYGAQAFSRASKIPPQLETCSTTPPQDSVAFDTALGEPPQDSTIQIALQVNFITWEGHEIKEGWYMKVDSILDVTNTYFEGYLKLVRNDLIYTFDLEEPLYLNDIRLDRQLENFLTDARFEEGSLNWYIVPSKDNLGGYTAVPSDPGFYGTDRAYDCVFTGYSYFHRKYVYNLPHEAGHNLGRLGHYNDPAGTRLGIDLNIMDYGAIKEGYSRDQLWQIVLNTSRYRDYLIL